MIQKANERLIHIQFDLRRGCEKNTFRPSNIQLSEKANVKQKRHPPNRLQGLVNNEQEQVRPIESKLNHKKIKRSLQLTQENVCVFTQVI